MSENLPAEVSVLRESVDAGSLGALQGKSPQLKDNGRKAAID
jgi:hypothetical protein